MFEISVASKYLLPRWRQLSISIISCISILVISLVVWLIVVFFSVTDGLENNWIRKLTSLTAPVRITPTEVYYQSYYYQIDSLSHASEYSLKTIEQKKSAHVTDPYDPEIDQEIPAFWPEPDHYSDGSLKDPVKLLYQAIAELPPLAGLKVDDFELTMSYIQLNLLRPSSSASPNSHSVESGLSYPTFLGHFAGVDAQLTRTLIPIQNEDMNNVLYRLSVDKNRKNLREFWNQVGFAHLKTAASGWLIPTSWLPYHAQWSAVAVMQGEQPIRLVIPQKSDEIQSLKELLESQGKKTSIEIIYITEGKSNFDKIPHYLAGGIEFPAKLTENAFSTAQENQDVQVEVEIPIQDSLLMGVTDFQSFLLGDGYLKNGSSRFWQGENLTLANLPQDPEGREAVFLPKNFRDVGARVGDYGSLSYVMPTASTVHEQLVPIYVAGFYDPGIIPIGGKFILANKALTSLISAAHQPEDHRATTNGINLHFDDLSEAQKVKTRIVELLKTKGIDRYWSVETFRDFEFTQGILQELQSQKTIFTLIAIVIILVACSNIISMLIILVNDKKVEIGILRSMGATSKSIALIFGLAGGFIGLFSSLLGVTAALTTLDHLPVLMRWIGHFQGVDLFQSAFYGEVPPQELSYSALSFVLMSTILISLLAGVAPAIKACLVRPSQILRSGGG